MWDKKVFLWRTGFCYGKSSVHTFSFSWWNQELIFLRCSPWEFGGYPEDKTHWSIAPTPKDYVPKSPFKCFYWFMAPNTSAPGKGVFSAVTLWISLPVQISEWQFALQTQFWWVWKIFLRLLLFCFFLSWRGGWWLPCSLMLELKPEIDIFFIYADLELFTELQIN